MDDGDKLRILQSGAEQAYNCWVHGCDVGRWLTCGSLGNGVTLRLWQPTAPRGNRTSSSVCPVLIRSANTTQAWPAHHFVYL